MYIVFFFKNVIEYFYIKYNQTSIIFKRDFNDLSYFEKLFLSFFYRENIFNKSIANIYKNNNLLNYRQKNYPLIFFFHLYFDKSDYVFSNLNLLTKQFLFFFNSRIFFRTINNLKFIFFKKYKKNNFLIYLIVQKLFFKRYYNLCSSIYFNKNNYKNLVKLNWLFYLFLTNSKGYLNIYDLSKYSDWYDFNFRFINKFKKIKISKVFNNRFDNKFNNKLHEFNLNKLNYFIKIYLHYNNIYKIFYLYVNKKYQNLILLNFNIFKNNNILLNTSWFKKLIFFYPIRFSETSVSKYIKLNNIKNYIFFYIRKNKIFNKGRYSRNRQLYRTGVYWCLWLNIMLVYSLYFMFYRFTFNFGYFWWGLLIFAYSIIFSRVVKYNFFNILHLINEFYFFYKWLGFIFINIKNVVLFFIKNVLNVYIIYLYIFFNDVFLSNFIYKNVIKFKFYVYNLFKFKDFRKFIYFWENMSYKDDSLLRYKSVLHWFTQLYNLLTY